MSETKSHLQEEIEEIFTDRLADPLTGSITAGVIYGIIKEDFRRIETGNWSERYQTTDFMRRNEERNKAAEHIGGFIYGMEAAGLISAEKSDQMQSELTEFVNSIRDQELEKMKNELNENVNNRPTVKAQKKQTVKAPKL